MKPLKLLAVAAVLAVAVCTPEDATKPEGDSLTAEQVAFLDQGANLGRDRAMFCPTLADCETHDIYGLRLFQFLAPRTEDLGENIRFFSVADEVDPGIVSHVDGSFALRSGITLRRVTITDELFGSPDFGFEYWESDDPAAGLWQSDVCTFEDMSRMPQSGPAFVNMWLRGGSRKRDVNAYIDCVNGLTDSVRAMNAKRRAEGKQPGCGLFVLEAWNEETGKWDLHASVLCPE